MSTTIYVPLHDTMSARLPIYAPLSKALRTINDNVIEINAALDFTIQKDSNYTEDFFSSDPLRIFRILKEIIEQPDALIGPQLYAYYPQMQNIWRQQEIWGKFLHADWNAHLHQKQLNTKLNSLFSRYEPDRIFNALSQFQILEGITGFDSLSSRRWALDNFSPIRFGALKF